MILTMDVPGKGKKAQPTPGTKSAAIDFFNGLPPRQSLRNSTVYLKALLGAATGIIFGVDKNAATAYVLTARHCLYTLAGKTDMEDTSPDDYTLQTYSSGIEIRYGPPDLYKAPGRGPALVSAINFAGLDPSKWDYDVVLLECTDANFIQFVQANRFITGMQDVAAYGELLQPANGSLPLLDRGKHRFIQLGYGSNVDPDWKNMNLDAYEKPAPTGKFQCKESFPKAAQLEPGGVFSVDLKKPASDWLTFTNVCVLTASNTNSTGPGDSGGPLFALPKASAEFYLVGVTSGANLFSNKSYKTSPKSAPTDLNYQNNIVTYWDRLFESFDWRTFF
jgi:hypothetical protein